MTREWSDPMRALEDLTPGGSEFYNNPARCVQHVRDRFETLRQISLRQGERIRALESRLADKDANIAQLIGLLEKAEAQNAALERLAVNPATQHGDGPIKAGASVVYGGSASVTASEGSALCAVCREGGDFIERQDHTNLPHEFVDVRDVAKGLRT